MNKASTFTTNMPLHFRKWEVIKMAFDGNLRIIINVSSQGNVATYTTYPYTTYKYKWIQWLWFKWLKIRIYLKIIKV